MEFVKPRVKVHLLDEGYACVPKRRDFTEDLKEEIWRNQIFWVWSALETSYHSTTLQEVRILPTLVYFHPLDCFKGGCLFDALRGYLAILEGFNGRFTARLWPTL